MPTSLTQTGLLALAEASINRALKLDPATSQRLAKLEGKVIEVISNSPQFRFYLLPHQKGLTLQSQISGDADTQLRADALAFLRLMGAKTPKARLTEDIEITGDLGLSQKLQAILADLDIDWEAQLASWLGDIPAHHISQRLRSGAKWGSQASGSLVQMIEEYLHEEARLLPGKAELEDFYADVDQLALAGDRLQARVQRILEAAPKTTQAAQGQRQCDD